MLIAGWPPPVTQAELEERRQTYAAKAPYCAKCHKRLEPALSHFDGEPTWCGYMPCPEHPGADTIREIPE